MKNTTKIGIVLTISIVFFVSEISVGFHTRSLALIADAFHYLNDIVAYAIAFIASYLHDSGQHTINFTYAFHRAELVGAFFNGVFLLALALSILLQAIERFVHVQVIDSPQSMLIVGCVGLGLNILSALVVHDHHGHGHGHKNHHSNSGTELQRIVSKPWHDHIHANHNHTTNPPTETAERNLGLAGVMLHLLGDAINNIGVIVAAILLWKLNTPKRFYADPAVSAMISLIIFTSAVPITRKVGRILLEAAPSHLDLAKIREDLMAIPDVLSVHDLHVWHLSQSVILASLHVCVPPGTLIDQWEKMEQTLQHCFSEYGVSHVTISPEIHRDGQMSESATQEGAKERCQLPTQDQFGCAVTELRKRKIVV